MDIAETISIKDAAVLKSVSRQAIAGAIDRGELAAVALSGRRLLNRSQVVAWMPRAYQGRAGSATVKTGHSEAAKAKMRTAQAQRRQREKASA